MNKLPAGGKSAPCEEALLLPLFVSFLAAQVLPSPVHAGLCNIRDFGALSDGKTLATLSIRAAIEECSTHGGGTVVIPSGVYLTGTIRLQSHITLQLNAGAVLLGSPNLAGLSKAGPRV